LTESRRPSTIALQRVKGVAYIPCHVCGRYIRFQEAVRERYCSEECAAEYAACRNCGRYFLKTKGYGDSYCSKLCTVQYRMQRFIGEEPV